MVKGNSDFEIQAFVVERLKNGNPLSFKIDRCLNRKYKRDIGKISGLSQEEFIRQWEASLAREEFEEIPWVGVKGAMRKKGP